MQNTTPLHVSHFSGSITEWFVDANGELLLEVKSLTNNRSKEYRHNVGVFLAEGRNRVVCKKLYALSE